MLATVYFKSTSIEVGDFPEEVVDRGVYDPEIGIERLKGPNQSQLQCSGYICVFCRCLIVSIFILNTAVS